MLKKVPIWSAFARSSSIYGIATLCEVLINDDDITDRVPRFSSEKREEMAMATHATKRTKGSWILAPGIEVADATTKPTIATSSITASCCVESCIIYKVWSEQFVIFDHRGTLIYFQCCCTAVMYCRYSTAADSGHRHVI